MEATSSAARRAAGRTWIVVCGCVRSASPTLAIRKPRRLKRSAVVRARPGTPAPFRTSMLAVDELPTQKARDLSPQVRLWLEDRRAGLADGGRHVRAVEHQTIRFTGIAQDGSGDGDHVQRTHVGRHRALHGERNGGQTRPAHRVHECRPHRAQHLLLAPDASEITVLMPRAGILGAPSRRPCAAVRRGC